MPLFLSHQEAPGEDGMVAYAYIPATQEVEIKMIAVRGQPRQKVKRPPSEQTKLDAEVHI
jgi:hypothetical protein